MQPGSLGRMKQATGQENSRRFRGCTAKLCGICRAQRRCASWYRTPIQSRRRTKYWRNAMPTWKPWNSSMCSRIEAGRATFARFLCSLTQRRAGILNWRFNGWAKYENWKKDDAVTETLAPRLGLQAWTPSFHGQRVVLEGGSLDVNGRGCLLTTEECLLSDVQARNPGLAREDLEQIFRDYLAATRTLWLKNGIAGDDTHGHIDDLARFTDARTVVIASEEDSSELNYEPLKENLALLREMRDQEGEPLRIETLPMPEPVFFNGQRLPASYANFYIANGLVLVPTFNDRNDRVALDKIAHLFPARKVIGIAATDLVLGLGTLHCMTQQQPAGA